MIISASRRTDIPAFFASWFTERARDGFCETPNPFNTRKISRISLAPEAVDVIIFWSKNPRSLMPYLRELDQMGHRYCIQFTLNGYGYRLERNVPDLKSSVRTFRDLAALTGPDKITWRYDPILISGMTDYAYHQRQFARLARLLCGSTRRVAISFFDPYRRPLAVLSGSKIVVRTDPGGKELAGLITAMAGTAVELGLEIYSCAEEIDLKPYGIMPGKCIDAAYLGRLFNLQLPAEKDKGQRPHCGCAPSKDIGRYGTCRHGCLYCYA